MIEIRHLEVMFEAERQRDEAVFAQLFARHITRHDDQQVRAAAVEQQASSERSVGEGSAAW